MIQQTKNVQAARQMRFRSLGEIVDRADLVKSYVQEAAEVARAGRKVALKRTSDFAVPEELALKFQGLPGLKQAFHALTPGRQRGYLLYFSAAKQSQTRVARIEKSVERILAGKGLDD